MGSGGGVWGEQAELLGRCQESRLEMATAVSHVKGEPRVLSRLWAAALQLGSLGQSHPLVPSSPLPSSLFPHPSSLVPHASSLFPCPPSLILPEM